MKTFFQWTSLSPPRDASAVQVQLANRYGMAAGILGLAMVLLGIDSGLALYLPILASAFVFGLPHGAIDHLVVLGLAKRSLTLKALLFVCLVYLGLVIAMLTLWWLAPFLAVTLFLFITIYHWGKADLAFEHLLNSSSRDETPKMLHFSHALLRGFFPIGLPFLTFPEATEAILNACSVSFGYHYELSDSLRLTVLFCLLALLVCEFVYLRQQKEQWKSRLAEDLGLLAFFTTVPPLLAVGLYFCFWHGLRHVLRLIRYEGKGVPLGTSTSQFKRFYCQALPFTLASIFMLGGILLLLPELGGLDALIGIYLVVISALTVPHLLVVEWMDRREGV